MDGKAVETIAVYWEKHVKVYGIHRKDSLCLTTLSFSTETMAECGQLIAELQNNLIRFEFLTGQQSSSSHLDIHLLCCMSKKKELLATVNSWRDRGHTVRLTLKEHLAAIFLHGPHFQDRPGIVHIAFNALSNSNIDIIISGCTGTSMYIVTSQESVDKSREILAKAFLIPN